MTILARVSVWYVLRKGNAMKDYIKEGLRNYDAPPVIYERICKALENPNLTDEEREELIKQRDKAESMAKKLSSIFGF